MKKEKLIQEKINPRKSFIYELHMSSNALNVNQNLPHWILFTLTPRFKSNLKPVNILICIICITVSYQIKSNHLFIHKALRGIAKLNKKH